MAAAIPQAINPGKQVARLVAAQKPQQKAAPRGIQAQAKAFRRKSKNAVKGPKLTKAQMQAQSASNYRKTALAAAYRTIKAYNQTKAAAQAAAVAAYATKRSYVQSVNGMQNQNLRNQIFNNYMRHSSLAGRIQFAQAGERKFVTTAIMNTVTQKQALSIVRTTAGAAARAGVKTLAPTNNRRHYALPAGGGSGGKSSAKAPALPRKAPASSLVATGEHSMNWHGRPQDPNCVPVAVANSLLSRTGFRLPRLLFRRFSAACGPEVTIPRAADILGVLLRDAEYPVYLISCRRLPLAFGRFGGYVIGYEAPRGPHAALSLGGGQIVSWGQEIAFTGPTDEVWSVTWREVL